MPNDELPIFGMAWILIGEKNYAEALPLLEDDSNANPLNLALLAAVYSGMGQNDAALELLDNALATGFRDTAWLATSEHFATLRALPAYAELMAKREIL
jgi:tetratricopeptide (TPR) repeat protein